MNQNLIDSQIFYLPKHYRIKINKQNGKNSRFKINSQRN
jgi:hypothetical protein